MENLTNLDIIAKIALGLVGGAGHVAGGKVLTTFLNHPKVKDFIDVIKSKFKLDRVDTETLTQQKAEELIKKIIETDESYRALFNEINEDIDVKILSENIDSEIKTGNIKIKQQGDISLLSDNKKSKINVGDITIE